MYFIRILNAQEDYDYDLETPFAEREEGIKKLKMSTNMEEQCLNFCSILNVIAKKLNFGKKERKKHKQPHGCECKPASALNGFRLDDRRI